MSDTHTNTLGAGRAKLRTIDCVAQSLAVGPIFSAAALGAILAELAGGVGPFVILITFIGILGVGWCVSEYAKRFSGSGTVYEMIAHGVGKPIAVWAAGVYHTAAVVLGGPSIGIIVGITAQGFFQQQLSINLAWWIWALIATALIFGVNAVGAQLSVKAQLTIITASLIPFAILIVAVIAKGGVSGNSLEPFNPGHVAAGGSIFNGTLFAILMFVGFELAAALGEETENPRRSIPIAVIATIVIVAVFYILTQYVGDIGSGGPQKIPFAFPDLAGAYVGNWLNVLISLAIMFDMIGVGIGFQSAGARGLFTLSRDGLLPRGISRTSERGAPIGAVSFVTVVSVIGVLLALIKYGTNPASAEEAFVIGATLGGMLIAGIYFVLCAGAFKMFAAERSVIGFVAAILGGLTAGAGVVSEFIPATAPTGDAVWGRNAAIVIAVLLVGWLFYNMRRRPDVVAAAAQHAIVHETTDPRSVALPQLQSDQAGA
jgi:amino acid transporter